MKILRVGFDLDGVILYNPVRTLRPIAETLKPLFFPKKNPHSFYIPKTGIEKWVWRLLHKTSFRPAEGLEKIRTLKKEKKIEPYLITGRYSFLKEDSLFWVETLKVNEIFCNFYMNEDNLQPNLFKEKMIKKLKLDVFVEDNFGIIKRLNSSTKTTKIFWITNLLDRKISYPYKFNNLNEAVSFLEEKFF